MKLGDDSKYLTLQMMLKITGIIVLILTVLIIVGQLALGQNLPIHVDRINYKAETVDTYLYKKSQHPTYASGTIFEFKDKKITTNNKDNTKSFYLEGPWFKDQLDGHDVKYIQAHDAGGFELVIFVGFHEKEQVYFIITAYTNVETLYMCKPSRFGIPKGYVPMKGHTMFEGEYTVGEMVEFVKFLSYWGVDLTEEQ